jgi:hypothetical protein
MDEKSSGIVINHRNIIPNPNNRDYIHPNEEILRFTLPIGEFIGSYMIRVVWSMPTETFTEGLNLQILENGSPIYNQSLDIGQDVHNSGNKIVVAFYDFYEYEFIVSTGPNVDPQWNLPVTVEYLELQPLPEKILLTDGEISIDPEGYNIRHKLEQSGYGSITGNNTPTNSTTITFPIPYKYGNEVMLTSTSSAHVIGGDFTEDLTGITVYLSSRTNANWTSTVYFYWRVTGDIDTPQLIE